MWMSKTLLMFPPPDGRSFIAQTIVQYGYEQAAMWIEAWREFDVVRVQRVVEVAIKPQCFSTSKQVESYQQGSLL